MGSSRVERRLVEVPIQAGPIECDGPAEADGALPSREVAPPPARSSDASAMEAAEERPVGPNPAISTPRRGEPGGGAGRIRGEAYGEMRRFLEEVAAGSLPPLPARTDRAVRDGTWPGQWSADRVAAGRFIAHMFGRLRARWGGRGLRPFPCVWRPSINSRCGYGQNLAPRSEFEGQAARAREVFDWDRAQAHLLKRLASGRTPLVLDLFCCAGGVSEGFRRGGGCAFGVDVDEQPAYIAR